MIEHSDLWKNFLAGFSQEQAEAIAEEQHLAIFRYHCEHPDIVKDEHNAAVVNWQKQRMMISPAGSA